MAMEDKKEKTIRTFGFDKPENPAFYEMSIGNESGYAYPVPIKGKTPKSLIECNVCDGIERKILGASSFSFEGTKEADIYHHPRHILASEKVLLLLRDSDIVGYKICEVNIEDSDKLNQEHLNQLREIEVVGRCYKIYSIDNNEINHCSACKKVPNDERIKADNGIIVVEEFWDGSDIFMFDYGLLSIVVTDKVKKIFEENKVNNVKFLPLKELKLR